MAYLVIIIFIVISAIQIPHYIKHKEYKEMGVYLFIMFLALLYGISGVTDWNFPDPTALLEKMYDPVSHLIFTNQVK